MTVEKNIGVQIFMNNKKTIKKIFAVFLLPALLLSGCGKQSSNKTLIPGSSILPAPTKAVTEMETKKANQIDLTGVLPVTAMPGETVLFYALQARGFCHNPP
jgi:uncharacterized protein YceK